MLLLASALIVAASVIWAAGRVSGAIARSRADAPDDRALRLLELFTPAIHAERDPRAMLLWEAHARRARAMFPLEFAALDRGAGGAFPFGKARIQAAHSQWTAEWLAWERSHDFEYKLKAAVLEQQLDDTAGPAVRAQIEAVEREKLDLYQRRYEEYVRVAKALQKLAES